MKNNCYIIAEIGSVHDGSFGNAIKLVKTAADCGVDAVKFQTHIADAESLPSAPAPRYFSGESRINYFKRTAFDKAQWLQIKECCHNCDVEFLSSPFSEEAVDLLENIGMPIYKVPSGEITNLPLIEKIARTRKQVLLSSGMSSWDELDAAVTAIRKFHNNIIILQCTTEYPCEYENVGLNVLEEMSRRYSLPVGLSDHTLTLFSSFAAVALGAVVIERHFTFSRYMYGSDAPHSLNPEELKELVAGIRAIEIMMEFKVDKNNIEPFIEMKNTFQKSLVSNVDISKGTILSREMIGAKKPGTGICASRLNEFIGAKALKNIKVDSLLKSEDFQRNLP